MVGHDESAAEADFLGAKFDLAQEVYGKAAENGHVLGAIVLADAAGIVVVGHVETPVEAVLNTPVFPHGTTDSGGISGQAADVVAPLDGLFLANDPGALHQGNACESTPFLTLGQPAELIGGDHSPVFDAPMPLVGLFEHAVGSVLPGCR